MLAKIKIGKGVIISDLCNKINIGFVGKWLLIYLTQCTMYIQPASIEKMLQPILSQAKQTPEATWLLMFAEKDAPMIEEMILILNRHKVLFLGGIFPGVISEYKKYDTGLVAGLLPPNTELLMVKGLENPDFNITELSTVKQCQVMQSALVLIDGLNANVATFLKQLYNVYGDIINYLGGGAGSLSLQRMPCVFNQEGIFQDAAIVAFVPVSSSLGIRHGWQKIVEPILATKTSKNIISELNWSNAFQVYKEVVEEKSGQKFQQTTFFELAKSYPFGINKEGLEVIVRDPIMVNESGQLVCVGEVPQNASLAILKGEKHALINAAEEAAALACSNPVEHDYNFHLMFDCISRVLFLEDDFQTELQAVKRGLNNPKKLMGALTLGEISSYGEGYIEFFNKTIVVGLLYA